MNLVMLALTVKNILFPFLFTQVYCVIIPNIIPNAKLDTKYFVNSFLDGTLHGCADMCVYVTACMSVSFGRKTKTCVMYNSTPTMVSTNEINRKPYDAKDFALFDIESWPKTRTWSCWNKPCGEKETCVPNGDSYRCNPGKETGCPSDTLPDHVKVNSVAYKGTSKSINDFGSVIPVGWAVNMYCQDPYVYRTQPRMSLKPRCTDTLTWSINYVCLLVSELCVHKTLENNFFPSRATITVTTSVSVWDAKEALLESGRGWIPSTNDDQQYIQIRLSSVQWIGGLTTTGGIVEGTGEARWVTSYTVSYSQTCNWKWRTISETFQANSDATSSVTNHFGEQEDAQCWRVHPQTFHVGIIMRLEMLKCRGDD